MYKLICFTVSLIFCQNCFAAVPGESAPVCEAKVMDTNQALNLNDFNNKVVLIDFWATWCPPCKQSIPFLNALRNEFQDEGFEIVAISVDENLDDVKKYLETNPIDYVVAYDSSGDCPSKYGVKAMPSSYFVDRHGKIREVHLGFRRIDEMEIRARVVELLKEEN